MKILLLIISLFALGCQYQNEETLYPVTSGCDSLSITYSRTIAPIIQSNCGNCHSANNSSAGGGNVFDNYTDVKNNIDIIIGCINHQSGYSSMPKGSSQKIDACAIRQIEKWALNGAVNN